MTLTDAQLETLARRDIRNVIDNYALGDDNTEDAIYHTHPDIWEASTSDQLDDLLARYVATVERIRDEHFPAAAS